MTNQNDSGLSLKDDIASIRTNPTFHDVVLVCADSVEIGACRAILASRSAVFKAMLYGNMQESISGRVSLQDIKSIAMDSVVRFIHTQYTWASVHLSGEPIQCDPAHPSRFRGEPSPPKLHWDRSRIVSGLVFSEEDTVVKGTDSSEITVRASTKCSADRDGICEWTIVIESLNNSYYSLVGLADESWDNSQGLHQAGWCLFSNLSRCDAIWYKDIIINRNYGVYIKNGDAVTFHLDLNNHTCALSVNGHNYGVARRDLPHNVNLHPAVSLCSGGKVRIKRCQ